MRTVSTGDLGFDVILGGGWRLVERLPGRESATVVLRGGPGTGKTLLSVDVALSLARALSGDVVVACVELLPSEYYSQIEAGRRELVRVPEESIVIVLPLTKPVPPFEWPRIFCGLLSELGEGEPDLVAALESLLKEVTAINGKPAVIVVDSLISGYGLGPKSPRKNVDAVMKFAAQEGLGIVLCEETSDDVPSVWDFASDTLLSLENSREGERQISVRKHRYGASASGSHQLQIDGWTHPEVYPRPDAWLNTSRIEPMIWNYGFKFDGERKHAQLRWIHQLHTNPQPSQSFRSSFALVSGPNLQLVRKQAFSLLPVDQASKWDMVVELDPLGFHSNARYFATENVRGINVPTTTGVKSAICKFVNFVGESWQNDTIGRPRRIVIGDMGTVTSFADHALWAEGVAVIAALVAESGWGIPVIAYSSNSVEVEALRWRADLVIESTNNLNGIMDVNITSRPDGTFETFHLSSERVSDPWPAELAHLVKHFW